MTSPAMTTATDITTTSIIITITMTVTAATGTNHGNTSTGASVKSGGSSGRAASRRRWQGTPSRSLRSSAGRKPAVHGVGIEQVHFHEVGALDTIVDIVAASSALRHAQRGRGQMFPHPRRLRYRHVAPTGCCRCQPRPPWKSSGGYRSTATDVKGELATPTGAALVKHFCTGFGPMPPLMVEAIGYGAGTREFGIPNLLRATVGTLDDNQAKG